MQFLFSRQPMHERLATFARFQACFPLKILVQKLPEDEVGKMFRNYHSLIVLYDR